MAWFAAALPYIGYASTALSAYSQLEQGKQQAAQQQLLAISREKAANASAAESQRVAIQERRKARNLMSRARAVAAASGAGASDPTVNTIMADIETQGEVNALNALYSGDVEAQGLRSGAAIARNEGRAYRTAGQLAGASTALDGTATFWREKYGS